jgi:hypothetical protein
MSDEPLPAWAPVTMIAGSDPAVLTATFRRSAKRVGVTAVVLVALAAGLLVLLAPWDGTTQGRSASGLGWLPVAVILLVPILLGRFYRAARGAAKIMDGPVYTLLLTTEAVPRVRYVAHLRRTPDGPEVAAIRIAYTRPAAWFPVAAEQANVYGSLEPGSPAVAVTAAGLYVGRIRR